jgi:hypothetical protein
MATYRVIHGIPGHEADLVDAVGSGSQRSVVLFAAPNCDENPFFELTLSVEEAQSLVATLNTAIRHAKRES